MSTSDSRAAWILLSVLALTAVIGFSQGLEHGLAAVHEATPNQPVDQQRDPVPRAQALSSAPLDEAAVRQIARQEAEAALSRARPKKVVPLPANDDADAQPDPSDTTGASSAPSASAPPAPTPAPAPG